MSQNARYAAKAVQDLRKKQLQHGWTQVPASVYAMEIVPPPPSLIREIPVPDVGEPAAAEQRRSKRLSLKVKPSKMRRIVYPEDALRKRFFRDHPYEAYRPVDLNEGEDIDAGSVSGPHWTALEQRTLYPKPNDCIEYALNLEEHHGVPRWPAYNMAVASYRALKAREETMRYAARMQATAYGATFKTLVDKNFAAESRVVGTWRKAGDVYDRVQQVKAASGGADLSRWQAQPDDQRPNERS